MRSTRKLRLGSRGLGVAVVALAIIALGSSGVATAGSAQRGDGLARSAAAQSGLVQDPAFLALKAEGRIGRDASGAPTVLARRVARDPVLILDTTVTGRVIEPEGSGYDDNHHWYSDANYWNFCSAGAAAVSAYYWRPGYLTGRAGQNYTEPYGPKRVTTYWAASDTDADTGNGYSSKGRGYVMYMAEKVAPPSFSRPGIDDFDAYPTTGGSLPDTRDALNWEASGRDPANWSNYWYSVNSPSVSQARFEIDLGNQVIWKSPPIIAVNTRANINGTWYHLPNWDHSVGHAIAVVGYNDKTSMFTYIDTCGRGCNSSAGNTNGGTHQVSYHTLWLLMKDHGTGYVDQVARLSLQGLIPSTSFASRSGNFA